jgi:general stress protein 26
MPGYGLAPAEGGDGLLPWSWAARHLERARHYWVATSRPDGSPHLAAVWGLWHDDAFHFSTGGRSRKARNLAANPIASLTCPPSPEVNLLIRAEARLVHDLDETRDLWARGVLPYDPSAFFSGPEDPETQFIELLPTVASIGTLWPSPPRRWRRS